jgi:tRNA1Val (adenine37-N6)-methyltransferase
MSTFKFKHFSIIQNVAAVKVGTDAMLLGTFTDVSKANNVLEIGTGTGVISLMLAQKNPKVNIVALEIHADTALEASSNIASSSYSNNVKVFNYDFLKFQTAEKFDVVVTNPPYFENGLFPDDLKMQIAKHVDKDTISDWFREISKVLQDEGTCWMILPSNSATEWEELANRFELFLVNKINLFAKPSVCKRVILCFAKKMDVIVQSDFTIRDTNGAYTLEYIELTSDFHDRIPVR